MGQELISVTVSSQAGVLWMSSDDPVVSKLMLEEMDQMREQKRNFVLSKSSKGRSREFRWKMYQEWKDLSMFEIY